jgi:hypothetical protein
MFSPKQWAPTTLVGFLWEVLIMKFKGIRDFLYFFLVFVAKSYFFVQRRIEVEF